MSRRGNYEPLVGFDGEVPRPPLWARILERRAALRDERLRHAPVRWQWWGWKLRVDAFGDGQWEAGLIVKGKRRSRLILHEGRASDLCEHLPRYLDPFESVVMERDETAKFLAELRAARLPRGVEPWMSDYLAALIGVCEECIRSDADGMYYEGP